MNRSLSTAWALFSLVALGACGGGGGGDGTTAAAPAPSPSPFASSSSPASATSGGTTAPAPAPAPTTVQGTDGNDTLQRSPEATVMAGGRGDDVYFVNDPAEEIVERPGEGIDEVRTTVGYTLPANVENMSVNNSNLLGGGNALVGNALDNRITGAAFTKADIFGLDGDDILDGGGRYGGNLDGGDGDDTLINNIGESRGGPGADTFVVSARLAHTAPDVPLTVLDFTPGEGDRIDGGFLNGGDPAALFASGHLRFDAAGQRLIYTLDPARFETSPTAVQQIILLPGLTSFDPSWIRRSGG